MRWISARWVGLFGCFRDRGLVRLSEERERGFGEDLSVHGINGFWKIGETVLLIGLEILYLERSWDIDDGVMFLYMNSCLVMLKFIRE